MAIRKIRRSLTLTPNGVGAVLDILGESFVAEDTTRWKDGATVPVDARRLASLLRVEELRLPPVMPDRPRPGSPGVPYFRFPTWLFCGTCRRMIRWSTRDEEYGRAPVCPNCPSSGRGRQLIPMRFVMVCGNGHLDDVDWAAWAHRDARDRERKQCQRAELMFEKVVGVGGGLESLRVRCVSCTPKGKGSSLRGLTAVGFRCRGRQPWQFADQAEGCGQPAVVVQRGASNVHFPLLSSAIDIPPESDWVSSGASNVLLRNEPLFKALLDTQTHDDFFPILVHQLVAKTGTSEEEILLAVGQLGGASSHVAADEESEAALRNDEWLAFLSPRDHQDPRDRFITRRVDIESPEGPAGHAALRNLRQLLGRVVLVSRLREVRALRGFYRFDQQRLVPPDLGAGLNWLPAIETYGEGIFLSLNQMAVAAWEERPEVRARAGLLNERLGASFHAKWLPAPSPRFLLLHGLAHLLIRQLTYSAGYSSSSLRERIYSTPAGNGEMAGMLIYTAAGDAEGTLGGLVRQGEPRSFLPALVVAVQQAQWCSLDPVCMESTGQGTDALSLAACHACALVAETSCESANVLLDRMLLVDPVTGFFGAVLPDLLAWEAEVMT